MPTQWSPIIKASCVEGLLSIMCEKKDPVVAIGEVDFDLPRPCPMCMAGSLFAVTADSHDIGQESETRIARVAF